MIFQRFTLVRTIANKRAASTMRFVQYKKKNDGTTNVGLLSENGKKVQELYPNKDMISLLSTGVLENPKNLTGKSELCVDNDIVLLPPVSKPDKIVCIGLNYSGHCAEQNKEPPKEPMFFSKFASTLVGPKDNVVLHKVTTKVDWEVELAVVIGKKAHLVSKESAYEYVFGYSVAQDISARDWQKSRNGGQFLIGKSMDTFCPLGPAIVHKLLVPDPHALEISCKINGVQKQLGSTNELIFRIDDIIHRLSQSMTLYPGDVILTGTPGGVGMYRTPPEYLQPGDVIESSIQNLGTICNTAVAPQK